MRAVRLICVAAVAGLAACGEPGQQPEGHGSTTPRYERVIKEESPLVDTEVPVRIGEYGPNFAACNARGTTRNLATAQLAVRAAPFDAAKVQGAVAPQGSFFVCARTHDQKWFGIVYGDGGADPACGVSAPVPSRRAYEGPCKSGWVSSAYVKLIGA